MHSFDSGAECARGIRRAWAWRALLTGESGQNLIEYSLLLAFVALTAAACVLGVGRLTTGLFQIANSRLMSASQ
jgi:Flp pilus assembly pilin Flp